MLSVGGRTLTRLVYADADGVAHPITEVWANGVLVWDGRVSATVFAQRGSMSWLGGVATASTSVVVAATEHGSMSLTGGDGTVSTSVGVDAERGDFTFSGGEVSTVVDTAVSGEGGSVVWEGGAGDAVVTFGAQFDPGEMAWSGGELAPQIDIVVTASPAAFFTIDGGQATVSIDVAVDGEPAVLTMTGGDGVVSSSSTVAVAEAGSLSMTGGTGTVSTSVTVNGDGAVMTLTGGEVTPEIVSGPTFVSATPGTSSASVTVPAGGSLVVAAYTNLAGDPTVTCTGGVTLTKAASSSQVTLFYAVGVAAGTYTITNTSGGSFKSFVAGVYSGVTAVSAGTLATGSSTTPSVTPAGSGLLAVSAFRGGSIPAGTTSNGDIRGRQATTSNDLVLVDRVSAPVSLSLSSSTAWAACAVWLT